jgi:hypothetical protein
VTVAGCNILSSSAQPVPKIDLNCYANARKEDYKASFEDARLEDRLH